ncbi:MAG: hypothetical protein L3J37_03260 [Rhodobacteraceae bacterium]|nr:hypothetical protein [Paracoccaceae bacterium]
MKPLLPLFMLVASVTSAFAGDTVVGIETNFTSPNGVVERCVRITPIPGGVYSSGDLEDEADYCAVDLYAENVALCPKTWSTSPGMQVYDISGGNYANDRASFMRNACPEGKSAKDLASDVWFKFKPTMNQSGTSGTFSASSLLYYHFSRYFDATVKVPVAVWRSMDAQAHLDEVARAGLALSGRARMNHEGWRALVGADQNPESYQPTDELFTSDRRQIFGVLLNSPGHRYGPSINGTRESGWGKGQNRDFQETPAFLALRSSSPLEQAIAQGLAAGRKVSAINRDLGPDVPPQQMVYWMKELTEIVLFDYIFSQQDRVGNIDYTPYYYWLENGEMTRQKAKKHERGDDTVPQDALLLMRTNLNDNDAGGRVQYANFTKSTQMLEKIRHFNGNTYRQLMALEADLQSQGEIYQWVASSFGLDERQINQVVVNTGLAANILRDTCEAGNLIFDLYPKRYFETGEVTPEQISCNGL